MPHPNINEKVGEGGGGGGAGRCCFIFSSYLYLLNAHMYLLPIILMNGVVQKNVIPQYHPIYWGYTQEVLETTLQTAVCLCFVWLGQG